MRLSHLILLSCVAALPAAGAETAATVRPEIIRELSRAVQLEYQGHLKEAEHLLLGMIRAAEAAGENNLELGVALNNLAALYVVTERHQDAERNFLRSIRIVESLPGQLAEQVMAKAKLHLAALYLDLGRSADAKKLDVTTLADKLASPEDRARAKSTLAGLLVLQNDRKTAEQIYLEVLAFWRDPAREDKGQVEIATILNNLAVIALAQDRLEVARTRLEQALEAWQRKFGPKHPNMAKAMGNMGTVCMELKQYDDAAMWLDRATSLAREVFGELHPFTVTTQLSYAQALKKAGRKSEAGHVAKLASEARKMMRNSSTAAYTVDYRDLIKANRR